MATQPAAEGRQEKRPKLQRSSPSSSRLPKQGREGDGGGPPEGGEGAQGGGSGPDRSSRSRRSSNDGDEGTTFTIHPDALECPICFEYLTEPVFQCYNGHIACQLCCAKLKECPACTSIIGLRCLAMEKFIESVKVSCPYASKGCGEIVCYTDRHEHREACIYSPCHCPVYECPFEGPMQELYDHFSITHKDHGTSFKYNLSFNFSLFQDQCFHVLRGGDGALFLILNNQKEPLDNAVMVACIGPGSMERKFSYKLAVKHEESSIEFQSSMTNIKNWDGDFPENDYLRIPRGYFGKHEFVILQICVQNKDKARGKFQRSCVRARKQGKA